MPRKKEHRLVLNLDKELHGFFKTYCAAKYSTMTQEIKQLILTLKKREDARKLRDLERQARMLELEQRLNAEKAKEL